MMERTILLTGATGGLGRGLAQALRQEPGRLILHGRDPEKLGDLHAELAAPKPRLISSWRTCRTGRRSWNWLRTFTL